MSTEKRLVSICCKASFASIGPGFCCYACGRTCKVELHRPTGPWAKDSAQLKDLEATFDNPVDHPSHYCSHPSGIECIQITEWMDFNLGNAVKYIFRCDEKNNAIEDLRKAAWYLNREIARRESENPMPKEL